jgi:hypothetical protein
LATVAAVVRDSLPAALMVGSAHPASLLPNFLFFDVFHLVFLLLLVFGLMLTADSWQLLMNLLHKFADGQEHK